MKVPVSVAIPVHNGEKFLEDAINSVINQTVLVKEILILEDSSTDNSLSLAFKLKEKNKNMNIKVYSTNERLHYSKNWNRAFYLSKSRYLIILHQDDILLDKSIQLLFNFLTSNIEFALVGGQEIYIDENKNILSKPKLSKTKIYKKGSIYEFIKYENSYIPCSSVMFDVEKINDVGYFDEDIIATDELFWPKVLTKYPIAILADNIILRRIHSNQTENQDFVKFEKDMIIIFNNFCKLIDYEKRTKYKNKIYKLLIWKFSKAWFGIATYLAKNNQKLLAKNYLLKTFKINKFSFLLFFILFKNSISLILSFTGLRKIVK